MAEILSETNILSDPIAQFAAWFKEAEADESIRLAEAMHLATLGVDGYPEDRVVLLKGFSAAGFVFYTNTHSAKGRALQANPRAALTFYWMALNRQVRIVGDAAPVTPAEADAYFKTRPRRSQLSSWASAQSEPVDDRAVLEKRMAELEKKYPQEVPRPPHWSGIRVAPRSIEFWINRDDRLHDRFLFRKSGDGWDPVVRLCP